MRIVLIEDHDLTRAGMKLTLRKEGIDVVGEAANGEQGLAMVGQYRPDIALVDIGLPDIDGIEVTKQIKAHYPETRVVILTLQDMEETVMAAFAAGADSYCMKDIGRENLLLALQVTCEGVSWLDPTIASKVLKQLKAPDRDRQETVLIQAEETEFADLLDAYPLTKRELEVLELIVQGCSNQAIAEKLYVTVGTVKTHVRNILSKLCVDDRAQAAVRALRSGLVT
ncbi:response regulator transcription factor [Candidatus Cyanaurora vandensis]|uniref:response regulator n=1 Tax=Candidatus Cyanaurora vandensis TaxID=2714958 RepID=UPI00257B0D97|nr:response regulator transcription factor [Candidatus Cyanaurora vandensis]